ncbi:uncharacterized protein LOC115344381 [Aquila chrysaetos chrysaetos]|uniref:uncharacterized protein LOC115344381 n=1 Tax=Aquila chrysaetos chrysaetos TaxID=223781 RepID=UPI0011770EF3|nr:uncharacterized protein LOC115344381 [Aquila chrysaetos chrysaetos]
MSSAVSAGKRAFQTCWNSPRAALVGDARLWRAGEEEAFCSRAVVAGAGPGCPAPAAPLEDNEPLLEAAVSLPHGGMSPRNVVDGSSLVKRIERGVQLAAIARQRGLSPVLFQGAPPRPPSPHSLGQRMLLAASGLLSPLPSIPNPASHRPPRVCAVSPSPRSRGRSQQAAGRHIGSPHAAKQRVSPYRRRQPWLNHPPDIPRTKDPFSSGFAVRVSPAPTRRLPGLPP